MEIFVEDKLARFLINTLCKSKGIGHYLKVNEFGPAFNCFTCASSAVLNNSSNLGNMLFVLDGDRYRTDAEKQEQINKVLTGNLNNHVLMRQDALSKISQFVLPIDVSPEEHIKNCILQLDYNELDANEKVIYDALVDIVNPLDRHSLIDAVVERLGEEIDVNLNEIVKLFAKSSEWDNVMDNLNTWFDSKAIELIEN